MPVDIKAWLDAHVVPLLGGILRIHAELHNCDPLKDVLVFLDCPADSGRWGGEIKRLLDAGWTFDFFRDAVRAEVGGQGVIIFGGDGAPFFTKTARPRAVCRLFKKTESGVNLILDVGAAHATVLEAAATIKTLFALYEGEDPVALCKRLSPAFGAA